MKINFKNTRLFRNLVGSKEYNQEEEYYIHPFAPREKTEVEFLPSYPPKLRIHGQIIPCPQELTIQDLYDQCMERDANILEKTIPTAGEQDNTPKELHPLRRQHLKNRLVELAYKERQQANQDDFTTRMYGKKDYATERKQILEELGQKDNTLYQGQKGSPHNEFVDNSNENNDSKYHKDTPSVIEKEINRYKRENPEQYETYMKEIEKEKNNNKPFTTNSLEEWQAKDKEFRNAGQPHCNTVMGSLLKERGIDLPANTSMNGIIDYMKKSPEWKEIPFRKNSASEHQLANKLASQGETVVFGQKREGHGHGGVLTGNPKMFTSKNFLNEKGEKILVPEIIGSIGKNEVTTQHLGFHLTNGKNASYFIYIGPKNE